MKRTADSQPALDFFSGLVDRQNNKSAKHWQVGPLRLSLPTMHVHHPWRGAVLWSRQLGAVLLIFALLLIFVLLEGQMKCRLQTQHSSSTQKHSACNNTTLKQQNKNCGAQIVFMENKIKRIMTKRYFAVKSEARHSF